MDGGFDRLRPRRTRHTAKDYERTHTLQGRRSRDGHQRHPPREHRADRRDPRPSDRPPDQGGRKCATWHVRAVSGRRTLVYRFGNGSIGMVKRYTEGPVPDFRLRPLPGIRVVYEQGRAGERDIADGKFTPMETLETDEVVIDRAIRVVVQR